MQINAIAQVNNEEKFRQTHKADKRQCDFNSDAQLWPLTAVRQLLFWTQIDFSFSLSLSLSLWKCPSDAVLIKPTGMHKCLWIALSLSFSGHYQHLITLLITLLVNEDVSGSCLCLCRRRIGIKTPSQSRIRTQTEPFWIQNHCLAFRFCCGCLCRSEATKIKHITLLFSVDCLNFSSEQCVQTDRYPAWLGQPTAFHYALLSEYTPWYCGAPWLSGLETCICIKL